MLLEGRSRSDEMCYTPWGSIEMWNLFSAFASKDVQKMFQR